MFYKIDKKKNIWNNKVGFTIIEVLAALAIIALIVAIPMYSFNEQKSKAILDSNYATVFHALESARSKAVTGVGTSSHGVHIEEDFVTVFEGGAYVPDEGVTYSLSPFIEITTDENDIIFQRLSGKADVGGNIIITNKVGETKEVNITENGSIQ